MLGLSTLSHLGRPTRPTHQGLLSHISISIIVINYTVISVYINFSIGYVPCIKAKVVEINIGIPPIMLHVLGCEKLAIHGRIIGPITVKEPFEMVHWNLMGPFPISIHDNKYILVITEYLAHWCEVVALPDSMASTVARALLQHIIFPHGCPQQLLSDQGPQVKFSKYLHKVWDQVIIYLTITSPN